MELRVSAPSPSSARSSSGHQPHGNAIDIFSSRPRRILVLYVGGTIGMKKNKEGALEPCAGYLTRQMGKMHELQASKEIAPFDIIEYEQLLDSSDMHGSDYLHITSDIRTHYDDYDGFLIAHGTDTMHYTASALSFLLYSLAKPVIVTGAMVPLAEPFNDARRNIIISMMIASSPRICEVCVFFNDRLFRGNRCDKVYHTYGAFESPNYPALGVMEATEFVLKERYLLPQPTGAMAVLSNLAGTVMVFHIYSDVDVDTIVAVLQTNRPNTETEVTTTAPAAEGAAPQGGASKVARAACEPNEAHESGNATSAATPPEKPLLDGVILVLHGVGSATGATAKLLRRIAAVAQRRRIVTVVTQPEGQGTFNTAELARLRVTAPSLIYTGDMTLAAAEIKLMYLFGKGLPPEKVGQWMVRNLRGELTPSTGVSNL